MIEFGATWCGPCKAAIPGLTSLSKKHQGKAVVMSFFVSETSLSGGLDFDYYIKRVQKYVSKHEISYLTAMDGPDEKLKINWIEPTNSAGVPKFFVIDTDGYIAYINHGYSQYAIKEIDDLLNKMYRGEYSRKISRESLVSEEEYDSRDYDHTKLLYIGGNGGNDPDIVFRSILTKYEGNARSNSNDYVGSWVWTPEGYHMRARIQETGVPIQQLYYLAYADTLSVDIFGRESSKFGPRTGPFPDTIADPYAKSAYGKWWPKPIVESSDKKLITEKRFIVGETYNYSLKVPKERNTARFLQKQMRQDLDDYFGYEVNVEIRDMPCWLLKVLGHDLPRKVRLSDNQEGEFTPIKTEYGHLYKNAEIKDIIRRMWKLGRTTRFKDIGLPQEMKNAPFIDATGFEGKIDYSITSEEANSIFYNKDETSFSKSKAYLKKLGLYLEKGTHPMKVVVIRDPKPIKVIEK